MAIQIASDVGPSRIRVAWESFGPDHAPPVLLIMGLGAQLLGWHEGFCAELVARGLRAIRFDNRDAGQSSHLPDASYDLSDMAADTIGLLDALGLADVHLVGASMGGFIAQIIAFDHPARVRSLTSMMSSTGDPTAGQPAPEALRVLGGIPARTRDEVSERAVKVIRAIGSPGLFHRSVVISTGPTIRRARAAWTGRR
jgi:pimeloyl-ACP methyl ester carboxylesterase